MKKTAKHLLECLGIGIGALWLAGCAGQARSRDDQPTVQTLTADSIAIHQVINPHQWAVSAGKAVVQTLRMDSLFYVYSLPDFRFLYAWGRRGNGPGEILPTQMLNAFDGDTDSLVLRFTAPATFRTYRVGQEAFTATDTLAVRSDGRGFSLRRPFPHGFVGDIRIKNKEEKEVLYVCRPGTEAQVVDSLELPTKVKAKYSDRGTLIELVRWNCPYLVVRGDRVAMVYQMVPHVDFYRLTPEGKLILEASTGVPLDQDLASRLETMAEAPRREFVAGFSATDRYLYVSRPTVEVDPETGQASILEAKVQVYRWEDGKLQSELLLGGSSIDILVTRDDRYLFARNPLEDFDWVYVYRLDLLRGKTSNDKE